MDTAFGLVLLRILPDFDLFALFALFKEELSILGEVIIFVFIFLNLGSLWTRSMTCRESHKLTKIVYFSINSKSIVIEPIYYFDF